MLKINYKGYVISQASNNHVAICKDDFLKKCYEWNKPFCLLLPITSLEGKNRGNMFRRYGIEVMVFDGRVQFMENMIENYSKKKSGNWFNTSWFCWKVLPKQLIFEKLEK